MDFKTRFKYFREIREWSQSKCAEKLGFTPAAISHFETGQREPSLKNLLKICKGFDITPNLLLGFTEVDYTVEENSFEKRLNSLEKKINEHINDFQDHPGRVIGESAMSQWIQPNVLNNEQPQHPTSEEE